MKINLLSYNIHKGLNWNNSEVMIGSIKKAIRELQPEIVFLQEVVGENDRLAKRHSNWPTESQFEYLADSVWKHYAYSHNAVYTEGHHGNAILSKYPIVWWENQDISTNDLEHRGLLHCTIKIRGVHVQTFCLHLNLTHRGRKKQYFDIQKRIENQIDPKEPLIVAGDFNDWNKGATDVFETSLHMKEAHKAIHGSYAKTYPVLRPLLSLDRIYVRNAEILKAEVFKGKKWRALSDHALLTASIDIPLGRKKK